MWGICLYMKVRKWVLFVLCLQQQEQNGMQRHVLKAVISELFNILANYLWSANFYHSCLYAGHDKFTSASHGWVTFLIFTANVWIMVWQTLLICLFTVWWVVSQYSGHMGSSGASPEFCTVLCHLLPAWQNTYTLLTGGSDDFCQTWVHLAILDGWFDKGQPLLKLAAQIFPFRYLVDFKGTRLALLLSKSGVTVCRKVSICLDHCAFA